MGLLTFGLTSNSKDSELDPESKQLIDSATVEGMHHDLNPEKSTTESSKETALPTNSTPETNPFLAETKKVDSIPEAEIENKLMEEVNLIPEIKAEDKTAAEPAPMETPSEEEEIELDFPIETTAKEKTIPAESEDKEPDVPAINTGGSNAGKIIATIFTVIIILALAGGGYYFFILKNSTTPEPLKPEIEIPIITEIIEPEIIPSNPKYLNLDFQESASSEEAIEEIRTYISDFKESQDSTLSEYVVSDLNNNPMTFEDFASRLGLDFPDSLLSLIGDDLRFFFYNDNANPGIGIVLESNDDSLLRIEFAKAEPKLLSYLTPLLSIIEAPAIPSDPIIFQETTYDGIANRYYNITSPTELSIDYIISGNNLFIGTTQMTIGTIYDLIQEESIEATVTNLQDKTTEIEGDSTELQDENTAIQTETPLLVDEQL